MTGSSWYLRVFAIKSHDFSVFMSKRHNFEFLLFLFSWRLVVQLQLLRAFASLLALRPLPLVNPEDPLSFATKKA